VWRTSLDGLQYGRNREDRKNVRDWERCKQNRDLIRHLADGNRPRIILEANIKHKLRDNGVDSGIVNPSTRKN
jgi:hypothetical protein